MKLVYDTETTGLPKNWNAPITDSENWPRIVQLSWVIINNTGEEVAMGNFIIKPDKWTISEEVAKLHGISQKIAEREGIELKTAMNYFLAAVNTCDTIIAHNLNFDDHIVGAEIFRLVKNAEYWAERKKGKKEICTMLKGIEICNLPRMKWPKLMELHKELFGGEFEGAHNALFDTRACAKCFIKMVEDKII